VKKTLLFHPLYCFIALHICIVNVVCMDSMNTAVHQDSPFNKAKIICQKIKSSENEFKSYYAFTIGIPNLCYGYMFYQGKLSSFNKSTAALECLTWLKRFGMLLSMAWYPLLFGLVESAYEYEEEKILNENGEQFTIVHFLKQGFKRFFLETFSFKKRLFNRTDIEVVRSEVAQFSFSHSGLRDVVMNQGTPGDLWYFLKNMTEEEQKKVFPNILKGVKVGAPMLFWGFYLYTVKSVFNTIQKDNVSRHELHEQLIQVAAYFNAIQELYNVCKNCKSLSDLPAYDIMDQFFGEKPSISSNTSKLLKLLHTNTFQGLPSFFSCSGRILVVHTLLIECIEELLPLIVAANDINAYVSTDANA